MRVAIFIIFVSSWSGAWAVGATPVLDQRGKYLIPTAERSPAATKDATGGAALRKNLPGAAADGLELRGGAAGGDRRLASLDPSQIVYGSAPGGAQIGQLDLQAAGLLDLNNGRLLLRPDLRLPDRPHLRSSGDFVLMGFVALMLIAYQLRKKHRFLRPHPFSY